MSMRVIDDKLEIRFTRTEKAIGVLRDLDVPLSAVREGEVVPNGLSAPTGLRMPGFAVPRSR